MAWRSRSSVWLLFAPRRWCAAVLRLEVVVVVVVVLVLVLVLVLVVVVVVLVVLFVLFVLLAEGCGCLWWGGKLSH